MNAAAHHRQTVKLLILAAAFVFLITFYLLYTRPMSLARMYRCDLENITEVLVDATAAADGDAPSGVDRIDYFTTLEPGDPGFDAIMAALRDRTFRRVPLPLRSDYTHYGNLQPGDMNWQLILHIHDGKDSSIRLYHYFGRLTGWDNMRLSTPDKEAFLAEISEIILTNVTPADALQ